MDDRLALRLSFDGHHTGVTPAEAATDAGWRSLVVTPSHDAGGTDDLAFRSLRALAASGVRLVWDGRGTGSWVDVGRARLRALERARDQVRAAASAGAGVVVLGCGAPTVDRSAAQPHEARWDQMAAGLAELAYEAEREGVQVALEALPTDGIADLDVVDRVVVDHQVSSGVRVGLDHSGPLASTPVPEAWWPEVAWIRLGVPAPGTWPSAGDAATAGARAAAEVFPAAVVETTVWGWEHRDLPVPVHGERVPTDV